MKKLINIFIVLILTLLLTSCFTSQDEVNKAKQNLWIIEGWENNINEWADIIENNEKENPIEVNSNTWEKLEEWIDVIENIEEVKEEIKKIEIRSITKNQLLKLDDLSSKNLLWWEVEISGKTLWDVDKIIVTFKNETSDFPNDVFQLKQFKAWDDKFLYRAFSKYETLDFWKNIYVFEAYKWDIVTKLELILNVIEDEESNSNSLELLDISKLPVNEKFWNPIDLWEWKIWYTDLRWLEIKSESVTWVECEKITSVLADRINWYFYWNTCRPIKDKEWISFYVIRLDEDKYIYEKHYYLPYQWIYWKQELETWTWVTKENIWEKNKELKIENENFAILEITDDLFKEILK